MTAIPVNITTSIDAGGFDYDAWVTASTLLHNTSAAVGSLLHKHRFIAAHSGHEMCANGWSGGAWADHITEVVSEFLANGTDNLD